MYENDRVLKYVDSLVLHNFLFNILANSLLPFEDGAFGAFFRWSNGELMCNGARMKII